MSKSGDKSDQAQKNQSVQSGPGINVVESLLMEARAYDSLDKIQSYLESSQDFGQLPIMPLYLVYKQLPVEQAAQYLTRLTSKQRQFFLDLDLWNKDDVDVHHFSFWVHAYAQVKSHKLKVEFVRSNEFLLFLKSRFNIWTFDVEDPLYPDHDYYFLTDDNLLLFEYDETCEDVAEVQLLIRVLYGELGVERAYAELFKITVDSFMTLTEDQYQLKRERLRDIGYVDYFDTLELEANFPNMNMLDHFIRTRTASSAQISAFSKAQALAPSALIAYEAKLAPLYDELNRIKDDKRWQFLHFNFIRMVNAVIARHHALKEGSVAMSRVGGLAREKIILGFEYLVDFAKRDKLPVGPEGLFERYDFMDLYRIGHSLVALTQKELKKALREHKIDDSEQTSVQQAFLGRFWDEYLDASLEQPVKFKGLIDIRYSQEEQNQLTSFEQFKLWRDSAQMLMAMLPFAMQFYQVLTKLKQEGRLQDSFYVNYSVDEIDLEALWLNFFAYHLLGIPVGDGEKKRLGLSLKEYQAFADFVVEKNGALKPRAKLDPLIERFGQQFGLTSIVRFNDYLWSLLKEHMEGYQLGELSAQDYQFVGGPIILA